MTFHATSPVPTSEPIGREIERLTARRVRMAEANEVLARWGPIQGEPDLFKLGLSRAQVRAILPKTGPYGFAPAEIAAVDAAIMRLRKIVRQIRAGCPDSGHTDHDQEDRH